MATLEQEREYLERHHEQTVEAWFFDKKALAGIGMGGAVIRFPTNQSFTMTPNAIRFANACLAATGADSYGTYAGHSPDPEHALDCFSPVSSNRNPPGTTTGLVLGDAIAKFAVANITKYNIDYVIWRQHIYNPEIAEYWRQMETRPGGVTGNHFDHVHVSFNEVDDSEPDPAPITKEDPMALSVRYIYKDQTPGSVGNLDWVFDGPSRIFAPVGALGVLKACDACKFPELGVVDQATHDWFSGVANGWRNG